MVGLILSPGDRAEITLKDSGECFVIEWGSKLTIESLRYSDDSGRGGIIYSETWVVPDGEVGEFVQAVEKAYAHSHDPVYNTTDMIVAFKERMQRQPTLVRIEFADRGMELEDVMLAIQRNDHEAFRRLMIAFNAAKKETP